HQFVDWMADYMESKEKYAVKSMVRPGEIYDHLPERPPQESESIDSIMDDFQHIIMPGMTHWQSPNFFAYFPANSSYPSILAEMLTATLGAQCMIWETSPAAAELEERVMKWIRQMINLPVDFEGVIQDTASSATLCAILSAREKKTNFQVNKNGFLPNKQFRIYCSTETHSSIEKAVKIAGIGNKNLVKVDVDEAFRLNPEALEEAISKDISRGFTPLCVIATIGTTGSTAIDPLKAIAEITSKYKIWLHVDAALAGSALVLPEYHWMIEGINKADSFVFNPHKWMFTNFDCSAYFVKDKETLIRTFEILPEYLKTSTRGAVNDYRDWGIALGRRFRALKLWFVIRDYGVRGIQEKIRYHISLAKHLASQIESEEDFELMAPVPLNTVCFRFHPKKVENLNRVNEKLLEALNNTGKLYLTHTKIYGQYTLRMVTSQTDVEEKHVERAWELIKELAQKEPTNN
ncbi:MAG: aminotransferase class I/II-fold pyridoxal phosphate-dependent enzyme, partial [Bacteroidales bacterium]|nr:aminotransferase class I/II-fold pyridoxal phosphate-dependent enzyme [Bacteroidales bacterium]